MINRFKPKNKLKARNQIKTMVRMTVLVQGNETKRIGTCDLRDASQPHDEGEAFILHGAHQRIGSNVIKQK